MPEEGVKNNNIIFKTLFTQLDIKPIAIMYKLNPTILMYKVHHHFHLGNGEWEWDQGMGSVIIKSFLCWGSSAGTERYA